MADPIIIVVFLRGGADGLSLISPTADTDYIAARPEELRVLRAGDTPGFAMDNPAADVDFRIHPNARGLWELYNAGEMAVVHAAGLTDGTRSHFDAEDRMERAAPGLGAGGWLGRCLREAAPGGILPALAVSGEAPESMRGTANIAVAERLQDLVLAAGGEIAPLLRTRLLEGFGSQPVLKAPVEQLISLNDTLAERLLDANGGGFMDYAPDVDYPDSDLARQFQTVAQAIKMDLGLRAATVDFGGWDTHENQAQDFSANVGGLASALMAFWRDLGNHAERTTLVVMSEFGRRLRANTTQGTDHGFGNAMLVLGGQVKGGRMYGEWPGLANDALDDGADLAITTDYRHVLAEILTHEVPDFSASTAFPGFDPQPRGLFG